MTAERRRAAGGDGRQHAPLNASEMFGVLSDVSSAVAAHDVGEFERRRRSHRLVRRRHLQRKPIQRARRRGDEARRDAGVARRRRKILVTQQDLDDADVGPALQKMGGEAVAQHMHADALVDPGRSGGGRSLHAIGAASLASRARRKRQWLGVRRDCARSPDRRPLGLLPCTNRRRLVGAAHVIAFANGAAASRDAAAYCSLVVPGDSRVDHEPAWLEVRGLFSVPLGTDAVAHERAGYFEALWAADLGACGSR